MDQLTAPPIEAPERVLRLFDEELRARLIELRRDLHRHPELSWREHRTAERLERAVRELLQVEPERVAETGVLARLPGRGGAPAVAVRGDIDALPIGEETGLEFASENEGVMHACGHDVHAAWAVGAAALLRRDPPPGDVVLVLQPAEEVGEGARRILESGRLDGVRAIFGAHVDRRFPVGEVVAQEGPVGAAADEFVLEITGRGGHGARPQLGTDPIVAGAAIVGALQTIVSRRVDPAAAAVVTVGTFHSGAAANVIPERAVLGGTLRSQTHEIRAALLGAVEQVARDIGRAHGVEVSVRVPAGTPPLLNDPRAAEWCRRAVAAILGEASIVPMPEANMGGEDFAYYLEAMPGCFLRIGAREAEGQLIGAHTPRFHAAEGSLFVGAAVLAESARRASRALETETSNAR